MISSIKNIVYKLPHESPNNIRLTKMFTYNSSHSTSNYNTSIFLQVQSFSQTFNTNIKLASCRKVPNLTVFWKHSFLYWVRSKNYMRKLPILVILFLTELSFLSKNRGICRNWNNYNGHRDR